MKQITHIETTPAGRYDYRLIGTATLEDDIEINFVYHHLDKYFVFISDPDYAEAIVKAMYKEEDGSEPDFNAVDHERIERMEALKLK